MQLGGRLGHAGGLCHRMGERGVCDREPGGIEGFHDVRRAHHKGHRFAEEPRPPVRENGLVREGRDHPESVDAGHICGGQDPEAVPARPGIEIPEGEGCMEMGRADGADGQGAGRCEIGAEHFPPVDLLLSVEAADRLADGGPRLRQDLRAHVMGRGKDSLDDLAIARAAAEDATERRFDLRLRGARRLAEEIRRRHQETRRADPALRGAMGEEGLLQAGIEVGFRRLHGLDRRPVRLRQRHQTGAVLRPVDQDRAGPAIARVAADLDGGETEIVAQHLREAARGRAGDLAAFAIDEKPVAPVDEIHAAAFRSRLAARARSSRTPALVRR